MSNKPNSTTLRDWCIKLTAEELGISDDIVNIVVSDSYKHANKATKEHNQIELSGFGKFMISQAKVRKKLGKYENYIQKLLLSLNTEQDISAIQKINESIQYATMIMEELKRRQNENKPI